ncbi:NB-ARC domain, LRR domain containing protein [Parasponia andersonii]|uniref:NB-ARC domain, LRR domain containing protein n=1 Tax=Parasponia andersonii TaxID=3476 RepID=A0A2P5DYJ9_PARAD|nr:NB-ARC domain, LRR domain containing protein [Parasponia andersonii]
MVKLGGVTHCPKDLEQSSHDIVRKCLGKPLVIATIAGSVSIKEKVEFEWQRELNNLNLRIDQNDPKLTRISKILSLIYHDLPYQLNLCFLYFAIFPEDHEIVDYMLYQMWIREGFVKGKGDKTLEQVAEEYLNELVNRNLIVVTRSGAEYTRVCRVYNLMHEIILLKVRLIDRDFHEIIEGIRKLENLQTLELVSVHPCGVRILNELKCLVQLRKLWRTKLTKEIDRDLCASIEKRKYLENLTLVSTNKDEVLDLQYISSPLPNQQSLYLLVELHLTRLKGLPNLVKLILYDAYDGAQLHFEEGGFGKVKEMIMAKSKELKVVNIDLGALPLLETLSIWDIPLLDEVPSIIQHLRNLKSTAVYDTPKEFVMHMQPNGGPDYFKIKHVPFVKVVYHESGVIYKLDDPDLLEYLLASGCLMSSWSCDKTSPEVLTFLYFLQISEY